MQSPRKGRGLPYGHEPSDLLSPNIPVDLTNCDREPIHIPSAIQPHGVLIAARSTDRRVAYISENSEQFLGVAPAAALAMTLEDLLGEEPARAILVVLDHEQYTPCDALTLSLPSRGGVSFDVLPHSHGGLIYVELEVCTGVRQWEVISNQMQSILGSLRRQQTLQQLCESAAKQVRALAGYDRVMIYRFDQDGHGAVIAEDKLPELEPLLGLHYPATDIPQQAQQLYLIQRVRAIVDVHYQPAAVLAGAEVAGHEPLDMSYCWLRSVSPLHLEYLQNMGVTASLAVSLIHEEALWGMIVCHHRTPRRPGVMVRALADLIGKLMSLLLGVAGQSEGYADRLLRQELMHTLSRALKFDLPIVEALANHGAEVLRATGSDGACVRVGGKVRLIGATPDQAAVETITAALRPHLVDGVAATDRLGELSPELAYLAPVASGVMKARILNEPGDAVIWFRGEHAQTVSWAGDPDISKSISPEGGDLRPRHSFAVWKQTRHGRSLPWEAADYESARTLTRMIALHLLRQSESEMAQLSRCDALTNLPNRRVLLEQLSQWRDSQTSEPAALLFLDIDNFKTVNDSLGHAIGDELLIQVSRRLSEAAEGTTHLVARLGGDEFVVFCRDTPVDDAERLAERIVKSFSAPFMIEGRPFRTSTSIGIAPLDASTTADPSDPLRAADSAMYVAKQRGGNQASVYESPQHERVLRQLQLEQGLFGALERGELQMEYQPQLACTTARVTGFEALLRWNHPVYGPIAPSEFIPLAERLGTIVPIGDWVLRQALGQLKTWRQCFHAGLTISVNVSATQVIKAQFLAQVEDALRQADLPGSALCIEVTETVLMQDRAVTQLSQVRELGVKISIDDFGTGYSSLSYLQRLPLDELKIDKLFLQGVGEDARKAGLLTGIVHMAHSLQLSVVAEGVETSQEWEYCVNVLLCDGAQGYYMCKPMPAERIDARMISGSYKKPTDLPIVTGNGCGSCKGGLEEPFLYTMAFQPIVDISDHSVYAYEALVRGIHNEPSEAILAWVNVTNKHAFDQNSRVKALTLAMRLGIAKTGARLAVNFLPGAVYSATACIQPTLKVARELGFPSERVIFEFRDGEDTVNPAHLQRIVDEYRHLGFLTAADDFGSSASGLNRLTRLQVDLLKVDMSLVRGIHQRPAAQAIVRAVVELAGSLGSRVVAKGVESEEEFSALRACGVSLMQGFFFAAPSLEQLPEVTFPGSLLTGTA